MADSDWKTGIREGYRTKTIRVGNCTVEINRPILSPEEQKKAEERLRNALAELAQFM